MRHGPISRAAFCKEIAEETFDLSPNAVGSKYWGDRCCQHATRYLSSMMHFHVQAIEQGADDAPLKYSAVAQALADIVFAADGIDRLEKKHGRDGVAKGLAKVYRDQYHARVSFEDRVKLAEDGKLPLNSMLEIQAMALDVAVVRAYDVDFQVGRICEDIRHWRDVREAHDRPPSAAEVADRVRLWLTVVDKLAWIEQHGDALPRRSAGS